MDFLPREEIRAAYRFEPFAPSTPGAEGHWIRTVFFNDDSESEPRKHIGQFLWAQYSDDGTLQETMDSLKNWVSRNGYHIVASSDLRRFKAGTRVEAIRSFKQLCGYAAAQ